MIEPKVIILDGKVTNASELRRYWKDRREILNRIQKGTFADLEREELPKLQEQVIVHRISHMSREESDLLQQTARKADYLLKKVLEKKPKKYKTYI